MNMPVNQGHLRFCALMASLAFAGGCVTSSARTAEPFGPGDDERVRIVVENHDFYDVTVHVVRQGVRFRLGTVGGMSKGTFQVGSDMLGTAGSYRLLADRIGVRGTFTTDPIPQLFGTTAVWSLEQSEWQSTLVIR